MHRYVAGWLTDRDGPWGEERFYLVAALFGAHPSAVTPGPGFGATCRQLQIKRPDAAAGIERRFVALLSADAPALRIHLRHLVALLSAGQIPVDWARLLTDLRWWPHSARRVQRQWARQFWKRTAPDNPEATNRPGESDTTANAATE
jgi:CRISPR system Cascade subunit CasB